ncbi:asparagine synthase-related protein [Phenylobacterium sp.]|jgi:asparagine synthase (glutamine-hydrolysing)|uniref:asparagine synthase-related protein n=1 Tax=Phenylobacterium sp. TaxID=1871053 RepID=UPI002E32B0D9|nr:asparagine synthase-related protein [Phenylobacterium sp.]HEX2558937.1 asparagine synthase-related protein [Phenylobacterium sp.]
MNASFLALAWCSEPEAGRLESAASALRAAGWAEAFAQRGLRVWTRQPSPLPFAVEDGGALLLVGRRHPRLPGQPEQPRSDVASRAEAVAQRLTREWWGSYVALIGEGGAGTWRVLRDPSGALDALVWRSGDVYIVASQLEEVPACLWPDELALDWDAVSEFVLHPWSAGSRCALAGVRSLVPGELASLDGRSAPVPIWRPLDWICSDAGPHGPWPRRLRELVVATVAALVAPYEPVLAEVSGGLDSAIVAAALGAAGLSPRVRTALHYFGDRSDSDERAWAAQVCDHWNLPISCVARSLEPFDPERDFLPLAQGARPPAAALDSWRDRQAAAELKAAGAQAIVTGMGGDAVFFQMPSALVLSDLLSARGPGALFDPAFPDMARWLRRSVWSVAGEALAGLRSVRSHAPRSRFAGPRALASAGGPGHPWLQHLHLGPPAKSLQMAALAGFQSILGRNRRSAAAAVIHPLLAQPVVELCLAIPTYQHVAGGRDRALARRAFEGLLPAAVLDRRSKGELTSHFSRRAAASLEHLRPWLLDGALVRAEVLDRKAVDLALRSDALIQRADGLALISAAAVEAWVRWWQSQIPDARSAPRRLG